MVEGRDSVCVPFRLPWHVAGPDRTEPPAPLAIDVALPADIPSGMVFVPSGKDWEGKEVPAFLIQASEVTYLEYAGWLDEVPDAERAQRLPRRGFEPDATSPGRYVVRAEWEDRPVTGIRPGDAAAYAAWRAEVFGKPYRLPTVRQFWRAAGGALLTAEHARLFRPQTAKGEGPLIPDRSPYRVDNLLGTPAELVQAVAPALEVVGLGAPFGIERTDADLRRTEPTPPTERLEAGFRLVLAAE
jgi:hypothetical protein